mmetsp:Transcript_9152/g.13734  ORF Transcript_9152/g.13734 Transcript_9152/m.13734 type:complete len:384 (-) Transcript_9152:128-1279(-)|eukprot:CAMPEP_0167754800 /NCGR_PEP_ID=MMETSP0110_2-20121227/8473_1 /TAXON_ID=629695 /ORGANISM="Gymnochlora sp., Strain CCMP2014" /LENGTH=383 /DNA_ID=CAMNT_0007640723 /DNA_START=137 /DNA_END=1288 /DNA_ORIENTATION=-
MSWEKSLSPSEYKNVNRVRMDVKELLAQSKSLIPKIEDYYFNNGSKATLLSIGGTIPIHFRGAQYNIPVKFYIPKEYPKKPPIGYVTPTINMRIRHGHPNVDDSGNIYMSYPIWRDNGTLSMMCFELMQKFSLKPPVYAARQPQNRARTVVRPHAQARPVAVARVVHPSQQHQPRYPQPHQAYPAQYYNGQQPQQHNSQYAAANAVHAVRSIPINPKAMLKEKLLKQAREKLKVMTTDKLNHRKEEIQRLLDFEAKLKQGEFYLTQTKGQMLDEKKQLINRSNLMEQQIKVLETWIKQNKDKKLDIDKDVDGKDTWSRQMLTEVAKDCALDDTLYALDKALEDGRIKLPEFLRMVRRLSKEQFRHRVLASKIMERQQARSVIQ